MLDTEKGPNGELAPIGGGDNIPLLQEHLVIGRRESCDVRLDFPNISGKHCEMKFKNGAWFIRDLDSTNGVKVDGEKIEAEKRLMPGNKVTIGKREFEILYTPTRMISDLDAEAEEAAEIMTTSLMERAGLSKGRRHTSEAKKRRPTREEEEFDFGE